ncbi:hypothetical protein EAM01S_18_00350 [Erwinia amylovora NBRC 12687 = CFBP 1232]|nr:hypothetical protein EAM01S_18_00350 [Erwinia amylovora NBRC 12687 = CFBP 1232]
MEANRTAPPGLRREQNLNLPGDKMTSQANNGVMAVPLATVTPGFILNLLTYTNIVPVAGCW